MPSGIEGRRTEPDWFQSRWLGILSLTGFAALFVLLAGNPVESWERQWFDCALRWRATLGWTPPADPRIVILGLDDKDMAGLHDLGQEYAAVAAAISQASDLGAAVIVLDTIYVRGTPEMAGPMLAAVKNGSPVVFAEALRGVPGSGETAQRLRSFPFLPESVRPFGLVNVSTDADGVFRSYHLWQWSGQNLEPSLALAADIALRYGEEGTALTERRVDARLLNARGAWADSAGFRHFTLRRLEELHAAQAPQGGQPLAGAIILFSNTATGVAEIGTTSFGPNQPLVLLHATALNDLLQHSAIRRAPRWGDALALLAVAAFGAGSARRSRKRGLLLVWLLGTALILAAGLVLIFKGGVLVGSIAAAGLWTIATVLELGRRHTLETVERRRLHDTMGLYFSPRVLSAVLENPGRLEPKEAEITVLMVDLRNSTPLTERLGPAAMLALLNQVFAVQTRAAFAEDGSLDAPVGDRFLAYWGAPDAHPDADDRALRAALALIDGLAALRETLAPEIRALFGFGAALHRGEVIIGNVGSAQYFHYGPVGDILNATARIESLTKHYGVTLLITREVLEKLATKPGHRLLDRVIVRGKTTPLDLIEIQHHLSPENFTQLARNYSEAFGFYQRGEFPEATRLFRTLAQNDAPSRLLAKRCAALAAAPPPDWTGVFKLDPEATTTTSTDRSL